MGVSKQDLLEDDADWQTAATGGLSVRGVLPVTAVNPSDEDFGLLDALSEDPLRIRGPNEN